MTRTKKPVSVTGVKGPMGRQGPIVFGMNVTDGPKLVIGHPVIAKLTRTELGHLLGAIPLADIPPALSLDFKNVVMWLKHGAETSP
jgi:hypothetical protein